MLVAGLPTPAPTSRIIALRSIAFDSALRTDGLSSGFLALFMISQNVVSSVYSTLCFDSSESPRTACTSASGTSVQSRSLLRYAA